MNEQFFSANTTMKIHMWRKIMDDMKPTMTRHHGWWKGAVKGAIERRAEIFSWNIRISSLEKESMMKFVEIALENFWWETQPWIYTCEGKSCTACNRQWPDIGADARERWGGWGEGPHAAGRGGEGRRRRPRGRGASPGALLMNWTFARGDPRILALPSPQEVVTRQIPQGPFCWFRLLAPIPRPEDVWYPTAQHTNRNSEQHTQTAVANSTHAFRLCGTANFVRRQTGRCAIVL